MAEAPRSPRRIELTTKCDLVVQVPGPDHRGLLFSLGDLYLREFEKLRTLGKTQPIADLEKQLENVIALRLAIDAFGPDQDAVAVHYNCEKPLPQPPV